MGNLEIAAVAVVFINVFLVLGSLAIVNINPGHTSSCMTWDNNYLTNNYVDKTTGQSRINSEYVDGNLPKTDSAIAPSSSVSSFIDIFVNIRNFFANALDYTTFMLASPYLVTACTGLPPFVAGVLAGAWYFITFLVFLAFMWGR